MQDYRIIQAAFNPGGHRKWRWQSSIPPGALDAPSAVASLSHDRKIDDAALVAGFPHPTGCIAALGSRRSHAARLERLAAMGIAKTDLARIEGLADLESRAIGVAGTARSVAAGVLRALSVERL